MTRTSRDLLDGQGPSGGHDPKFGTGQIHLIDTSGLVELESFGTPRLSLPRDDHVRCIGQIVIDDRIEFILSSSRFASFLSDRRPTCLGFDLTRRPSRDPTGSGKPLPHRPIRRSLIRFPRWVPHRDQLGSRVSIVDSFGGQAQEFIRRPRPSFDG